jgi:hypothetical protein
MNNTEKTAKKTTDFLQGLGVPVCDSNLSASPKRFPDGAQYRIEIPSCENPQSLAAVLEEANRYQVRVHRVSQGSGIMLLTDAEISEMLRMAKQAKIELSLFVGPRAPFDTSPQPLAPSGKVIGWNLRGCAQLTYAVEDVKRGCDLGLRSVLVCDLGLLWILDEMKRAGELPANLRIKISILQSIPNAATAKIIERLGATTLNVSPDLSLEHFWEIRQAVDTPLDVYVEVPDGFGGYIRYYEAPEMIRVASPMYVKLGLRNAPDIYPSGRQLEQTGILMSRERVRRARIVLDLIERYTPEAKMSKEGPSDLGIPEI